MSEQTITLGVIVSTRGFFNPEVARADRARLLKKLEALHIRSVCLPAAHSRDGLVEPPQDAARCAALFRAHGEEIAGILISLPNFGDEAAVTDAVRGADLGVPVLVQAADDELDRMDLAGRRDAFCGKLSVCNNLRQHGIRFTDTSQHTCGVESPEFERDLLGFARVCRVVRGLRGLRVGQVGTRPAAFRTVRYSEKLLQRAGVTVIPAELSEIMARARALGDAPAVGETAARIRAYGAVETCVPEENVLRQARLYLALREWLEENGCGAGTIQCWDALQKDYGCASCLAMSLLGEDGIPMACETDVMGAVTMAAVALASGGPAGYLDWNNSFGGDRDKCIAIHCSAYPKSFFGAPFSIGNLDILGKSLGFERCFGACKGRVAPGEMTCAKITTDEFEGKIRAYVAQGEFTGDPVETLGGVAVCRVPGLQKLMHTICTGGFEHHVAMGRGRSAEVLAEAFSYLGWETYFHAGERASV